MKEADCCFCLRRLVSLLRLTDPCHRSELPNRLFTTDTCEPRRELTSAATIICKDTEFFDRKSSVHSLVTRHCHLLRGCTPDGRASHFELQEGHENRLLNAAQQLPLHLPYQDCCNFVALSCASCNV